MLCLLYAEYSKWLLSQLFEYLLPVSHMLLTLPGLEDLQCRHLGIGGLVPEFWASVMFFIPFGEELDSVKACVVEEE